MITYFPEIYPDELMYSWFCRYYVHSGSLNRGMTLIKLFSINSDNQRDNMIGNLRPEVKKLFERMYSLQNLVLDHTMYPQFVRFMPLEQKKMFLDTLSIPSGEKYFRFCPVCVEEDRAVYGETFWHRKHQIHTMLVCPKHGCRLTESNILAANEKTYTFYPAEQYVFETKAESVKKELRQYAEYLETVFDAPMDFKQDRKIHLQLYDQMCRQMSLKLSVRKQRLQTFAEDLCEFYRNMDRSCTANRDYIQKVLLGERLEFSAVCQTAFFLGMKPEELTVPPFSEKQIPEEPAENCIDSDIIIEDTEMLSRVEQTARAIYDGTASKIGRPERVTERVVCHEMNLSEQILADMPQCKAVLKRYEETYSEYRARKMVWAYQKLKEEKKKVSWSELKELANMKKKNIPAVIPYLEKYADIETVQHIITLLE